MSDRSFGMALTLARTRIKKSQGAVAREVGMDPSYLAGIENDKRKAPNAETTLKLATAVGASPGQTDRLITYAVTDRLLDVIDDFGSDSRVVKRIERLLRDVAELGESEWDSIHWAVATLVHLRAQKKAAVE